MFPALALSEEVTFDDLVEREGIYYKKFTDVPFTGKTTGQKQGTFKNGKKEGPWIEYWTNGRLKYKGFYKNGNREGPWVGYHKNGQLFSKGNYKNGEKERHWVVYLKNGQVDQELSGTYKNGVKVD